MTKSENPPAANCRRIFYAVQVPYLNFDNFAAAKANYYEKISQNILKQRWGRSFRLVMDNRDYCGNLSFGSKRR